MRGISKQKRPITLFFGNPAFAYARYCGDLHELQGRHSREGGNPTQKIGFRVKPGMTIKVKTFLNHYTILFPQNHLLHNTPVLVFSLIY